MATLIRIASVLTTLIVTAFVAVAEPADKNGRDAASVEILAGDVRIERTTAVTDVNWTQVEGSPAVVAWWNEAGRPWYALSLDGGPAVVRPASHVIPLLFRAFDPLRETPVLRPALAADESVNLHLVQFVTQPIAEYFDVIATLGGRVHKAVGGQTVIVCAAPGVIDQVAALPFVRWVGPLHPAYRLETYILDEVLAEPADPMPREYSILAIRSGLDARQEIADRIEALGGVVNKLPAGGVVLEATLTPEQLLAVARHDEVLFIDRVLPVVDYLDIVRIVGGANYVESVAGFTGAGVRGEVMDSNLFDAHQAFAAIPPIFHGSHSGSASHGTSVYGICFGSGAGNAAGRGLIPAAQGIFADYGFLVDRYTHTGQLVQPPYEAVFQTNSWGSCCTTAYGTAAAAIDDAVFDHDIVLLQAQANSGSQSSDAIAFAKNIVSVGGIRHINTATLADDNWSNAGSIGPASDGRIKPDLAFWYDSILTTADGGGYTTGFGGTSAATPTTAGHFGLFFQMWNTGAFGNHVAPGGTVFQNRPHMATSKAMMINNCTPYPFAGAAADLTRTHQGWGRADVKRLWDSRNSLFVVDETDVLTNLQVRTYQFVVLFDSEEFRATLVYTDPPGVPNSTQHRINDLTLKVTSPIGTVYWGNRGLLEGNASTAGGVANTIDTVENVWVSLPTSGIWTVQVLADEVVQDSHVETPGVDADYALVVSGIVPPSRLLGDVNCDGFVNVLDVNPFVLALLDADSYRALYPLCDILNADANGDDSVDVLDVNAFVDLIVGGL
ncbi:hypothetical protein RAS1_02600 [Phycisphaerae bacterium RAS1]|nr:hypothetical protein RAS1_02600 [Phycisphaerae bacterium RAS1]